MSKPPRCAALTGAVLFISALVAAGEAAAAGQRSFVSTSGADNPACGITTPCRTFGAAITATSPGGEVIVLTSGGYGTVTITQSVSIIASPGVYAGISVSSGDGITVTTAAATDVVTLRGLTINNIGSGGNGINFNGVGRLQVTDSSATGFGAGAGLVLAPSAASELVVERSNFSGNGRGIGLYPGAGIAVRAMLDGVRVHHNSDLGIFVLNNVTAAVRNSVIANNSASGLGVFPQAAGSSTQVTIKSTEIASNGAIGVWAGDPNGSSAVTIDGCMIVNNDTGIFTTDAAEIRLTRNTISRNTTGISYLSGGLARSQGTNLIDGNGADGTAPTVVGGK